MKTCILAIQRYERIEDLKEWIRYHIDIVHIDHIFLLDNNDQKDALKIDDPNLTILPCYNITINIGDSTWQCNAYNYGLEYIKLLDYQWIAVIDADEFITLRKHSDIKDFIQEQCIDKGFNNTELKWELYTDNDIFYYDPKYGGNVLTTYKDHHPVDKSNNWNFFSYVSMKHFLKFIGKITPELRYDDSPHYPSKKLYDQKIYNKNICSEQVAVLRHYKYKSLEDFISLKAKLRSYTKSVHGSTWKYTRTYFEDNYAYTEKIIAFAILACKHNLEMDEWDMSHLQEQLSRTTGYDKNIFYIWFGNNDISSNKQDIINQCTESVNNYYNTHGFNIFQLNEETLHIDVCPYVRFMYDHKLYGLCADFFKCLLLYYFGGVYLDYDVELCGDLNDYYNRNDYMLFDASFYNNGAWFTSNHCISSSFMISKPFNKLFLEFINYCKSFTYDQLENMYNEMNKKDFMDYFYDVKIFYYHVIKKNNINIHYVEDLNYTVEKINELESITLFDNKFIEPIKYNENINTFVIHHNIKTHEDIYLNNI